MPEQPSGTVTFLFSDIEGSTRLLDAVGAETFERILHDHRRIIGDAIARHDGHLVSSEGDACFAAFARPSDAVASALAAQLALGARGLADGAPVRVRIGIHTGEARLTSGRYVGMAVHQAARVMSAANGGQILVSGASRALLDDGELADLGTHRLKDLSRPVRLFEVRHPDLPGAGAEPRSLHAGRHNLPVQPTPFVGRDDEVREIRTLLLDDDVRLVTLTGPGGIGKTRLALQGAAEVADDVPDGVWFVPLAAVADPDGVAPAVAAALGADDEAALGQHLSGRRLVLVLDNLEQLVPGAEAFVAGLVRTHEGVTVLATSRVPLRIAAERISPVEPMDAGGDAAGIASSDAVRLFAERARAADPSFSIDATSAPIVAEICRRLDGLPLAIELAAARVPLLGLDGLLREGPSGVGVGPADAPERHRTLEATIAWSYDLLPGTIRRVFRALGVFRSGFDVEDAAAVAGATIGDVAVLVDHSLVRGVEDAPVLTMLETIRAFALARLDEHGERAAAEDRHAQRFADLAQRSVAGLHGPDNRRWRERLEPAQDDVRAALDHLWARDDRIGAARMTLAMCSYWRLRRRMREAAGRLDAALDRITDDAPERAHLLLARARLDRLPNDLSLRGEARELVLQALRVAMRHGDDRAIAIALMEIAGFPSEVSRAAALDVIEPGASKAPPARQLLERALVHADRAGDQALVSEIRGHPFLVGGFRGFLGMLGGRTFDAAAEEALRRGDRASAASLFARRSSGIPTKAGEAGLRRAVELGRETGDAAAVAVSLARLGQATARRGDIAGAAELFREAMSVAGELDDPATESAVTHELLLTAGDLGDVRTIRAVADAHLEIARTHRGRSGAYMFGSFVGRASRGIAGLRATSGASGVVAGALWSAGWVLRERPGGRIALVAAAYLAIGFLTRRNLEAYFTGRAPRRTPFVGLLGVLAWIPAGLTGSVTAGGVTLCFLLAVRSALMRERRAAGVLLAGTALAGAIVPAIAIPCALVWTVGFGLAYRPARGAWIAAQTGAVLLLVWRGPLFADVIVRWREGGLPDLGLWGDPATVAVAAGAAVVAAALALSAWRYVPGGLVVAVTAPVLPGALPGPDVATGIAFGVGCVLLGVAKLTEPPVAGLPLYEPEAGDRAPA